MEASEIDLPTVRDVRDAAQRIAPYVVRTPTIRAYRLERRLGGPRLWLKCENLQRIGAFKARGAVHAVLRLVERRRPRALVTYSSGNHAQAVAYAGTVTGLPVIVAMPEDAPAIKVAGVRALGARVVFAGTTSEHRRVAAERIAAEEDATIVQPFDDPDIIAGQATATLELDQDVHEAVGRSPDVLYVPVGGGGLVAGAALAAADGTRIHTVEPATCDAMARSLEAGERVAVEPGPTLADGLKPVKVGVRNFEIVRRRGATPVRVDDDDIGAALVALLRDEHLLVEPSAAAALAAAFRAEPVPDVQDVAVVLSGGNVAPELVGDLLGRYGGEP